VTERLVEGTIGVAALVNVAKCWRSFGKPSWKHVTIKSSSWKFRTKVRD